MRFLVLIGWHVIQWPEETTIVVPINPVKSGMFERIDGSPWLASVDRFSLVQAESLLLGCPLDWGAYGGAGD
jgi:hypothetical protein